MFLVLRRDIVWTFPLDIDGWCKNSSMEGRLLLSVSTMDAISLPKSVVHSYMNDLIRVYISLTLGIPKSLLKKNGDFPSYASMAKTARPQRSIFGVTQY